MNTIYNFLNPQSTTTKGIIEMFDIYEGRYGTMAIDGETTEEVYDSDFCTEVNKRKFIKKCVKLTGVPEDKLTFIYYDVEGYATKILEAAGDNYDSGMYGGHYDNFFDFVKANAHVPFTSNQCKVVAIGVDDLEENYSN